MAKKTKKGPGDRIHIRLKQDEPDYIIDWINAQSEISESLRVLIAKQVSEHGFKDVCSPMNSFQFAEMNTSRIGVITETAKTTSIPHITEESGGVEHSNKEPVVNPSDILNATSQTNGAELESTSDNNINEDTQTKIKKKPKRNIELSNW